MDTRETTHAPEETGLLRRGFFPRREQTPQESAPMTDTPGLDETAVRSAFDEALAKIEGSAAELMKGAHAAFMAEKPPAARTTAPVHFPRRDEDFRLTSRGDFRIFPSPGDARARSFQRANPEKNERLPSRPPRRRQERKRLTSGRACERLGIRRWTAPVP